MQDRFVNAWVLARDLEQLASASESEDFGKLCRLIEANYEYPVDTVLISPELEVLGHINVNDATSRGPGFYKAFLLRGLGEEVEGFEQADFQASHAAHHPHKAVHESPGKVALTPAQPSASLLDVFFASEEGQVPFQLFAVDATAFQDGGTIEIEIEVGSSNTTGDFELLVTDLEHDPPILRPVASLHDVEPGGKKTMTHTFKRGQVFRLLTRVGHGSPPGAKNAFLASFAIRTEPEQNPPPIRSRHR